MGADRGGILAARIIATSDATLQATLVGYQESLSAMAREKGKVVRGEA